MRRKNAAVPRVRDALGWGTWKGSDCRGALDYSRSGTGVACRLTIPYTLRCAFVRPWSRSLRSLTLPARLGHSHSFALTQSFLQQTHPIAGERHAATLRHGWFVRNTAQQRTNSFRASATIAGFFRVVPPAVNRSYTERAHTL